MILTKTGRKSTNQIEHFQKHPNFLVYDKYERSYSLVKLIENPGFETGLYAKSGFLMIFCQKQIARSLLGEFSRRDGWSFGSDIYSESIKTYLMCNKKIWKRSGHDLDDS